MFKKSLALIMAVFMLSVLAVGCGEGAAPAPPPTTTPASGNTSTPAATGEVLKIGAISSLSGQLQDYGECYQRGFTLGMEYMTGGTNVVAGRPIEIIWEDTTNTPDVAKERTMKLLEQDKVEIVTGYASSGDAVACLPLFEEYKTVCVVEPAAADSIISAENWNEYIFRTGRTSGQDALAMAAIIAKATPGATIACFAPDSTYGYGMVDPFVAAVEAAGCTVVAKEYAPVDASDFSPYFLRIKDKQPDYLYVSWAGANSPWTQLMELDLESAGITVTTGAPDLPQLRGMLPLGATGAIGYCVYYPTLPQTEVNDWLVKRHNEEYGSNPDFFTSGGMAAAMAICTALEKTNGVTDPDVLIAAMEGMEFDSPSGMRTFRPEDHQAMQDLYEIKFTNVDGADHVVPEYIRTIKADEVAPPITNGRG
ncbi:substrate-binding domain-containing protein [Ruminococcaceae bacterium OttesenSCG-928-A16]|nr:substrate-binding domain-containing protein [Ruminococcaceae bacterium OttesenSCG-928-A16]